MKEKPNFDNLEKITGGVGGWESPYHGIAFSVGDPQFAGCKEYRPKQELNLCHGSLLRLNRIVDLCLSRIINGA